MIDGLAGNDKLFFIAACNDVRRCDPALVRAGRLNPVVEIGLPGLTDLEKMFRVRLGQDLEDADLTDICEMTLGGAGADVERIVADARRVARHDRGRPLRMSDLRSVVREADDRPEALRRRAAVHEAGHIILDVSFYGPAGVHATINVSRDSAGAVVRTELPRLPGTYDDYFRRLQMLLAGRTAESLILGSVSHGAGGAAGSDLERAAGAAAAMVGSFGLAGARPLLYLGPRDRPDELLAYADVRLAANDELVKAELACRKLLMLKIGAVRAVADRLLKDGRIDGATVEVLINGHAETAQPTATAAVRQHGGLGPRIKTDDSK
jgi:ATP-dependent Zn protease